MMRYVAMFSVNLLNLSTMGCLMEWCLGDVLEINTYATAKDEKYYDFA